MPNRVQRQNPLCWMRASLYVPPTDLNWTTLKTASGTCGASALTLSYPVQGSTANDRNGNSIVVHHSTVQGTLSLIGTGGGGSTAAPPFKIPVVFVALVLDTQRGSSLVPPAPSEIFDFDVNLSHPVVNPYGLARYRVLDSVTLDLPTVPPLYVVSATAAQYATVRVEFSLETNELIASHFQDPAYIVASDNNLLVVVISSDPAQAPFFGYDFAYRHFFEV